MLIQLHCSLWHCHGCKIETLDHVTFVRFALEIGESGASTLQCNQGIKRGVYEWANSFQHACAIVILTVRWLGNAHFL